MANYIALDWEKRTLSGLEAEASKGRAQVRRRFELQWPDQNAESSADPLQTGNWLRGELQQLGIEARRVLVSLPREEVVVRQLEVPAVPDEELPDLVRLQAETKLSTSIDSLVLDFLPLPAFEGETSRAVLLFTLARPKLKTIQDIIEAAGLELARVGVSSAATAEMATRIEGARPDSAGETTLTFSRHGKRVELSLMRQRHLLFAHSSQLTGDDEQQDSRLASAEIRRALGAHSRIDADVTVNRVWAIGTEDENEVFCRTIAEQLNCQVGSIDPLSNALVTGTDPASVASHAPYGGPLGMLLAAEESQVAGIDFLNPRQTVVRADRRNLKAAAIAAGVLLLVASWYGITQWQIASINDQVEENTANLKRFTESISRGRPTVAAAETVRDWQSHSDDWLARMGDLNQVFPGTDRLYLKNYRFSPASGDSAGHIHADGFARSDRDVFDLYQRLSERGYSVQPQTVLRTDKDKDYPYGFQLELNVAIAKNTQKKTKASTK